MHTLEEIHQYQLDMSLPKIVTLNTCGVVSMIQVLKYFNKLKTTPEEIFYQFVNAGKYSGRVVNLNFSELPGISIPYASLREDQPEKNALQEVRKWRLENNVTEDFSVNISKPNSSEYLPTFSLKHGSDSRGMKHFLEQAGLNVILYEYLREGVLKYRTSSHITTNIKGNFIRSLERELSFGKLIIASVKKTEIPHLKEIAVSIYGESSRKLIGTHLIVLKQEGNEIYTVDPIVETPEKAVRKLDKNNLFNALVKNRKMGRFLAIKS